MDSRVGKLDFVYRTVKYSNYTDCACAKTKNRIVNNILNIDNLIDTSFLFINGYHAKTAMA